MAIAAPPLLERLEMEHALDMQRLRSEQAAQQLKSGARALRQEERTSQALREELAEKAKTLTETMAFCEELMAQVESAKA